MLYHYAKVFSAREVVGLNESFSQVSFSSFLPKYHAYPKQKSLLHAKRSVQGTRCMNQNFQPQISAILVSHMLHREARGLLPSDCEDVPPNTFRIAVRLRRPDIFDWTCTA